MRPRLAVRRGLSALLAVPLATVPLVAGCGTEDPVPAPTAAPAVSPSVASDARSELAARAARAQDRRYTAVYVLDSRDRPPRQVVATSATDGSWRVDIPGGARGGTADVSVVGIEAGVFVCSLPSASDRQASTCARAADPEARIPQRYDPGVQRVFHDWLEVFTDRQEALSVSTARPLEGVQGTCYAVDSTSAALRDPLDVGIYCYADDGLLTGARVAFGELRLAAAPAAPPPSVDLPGPVVGGDPIGQAAPPPRPEPETRPSDGPA